MKLKFLTFVLLLFVFKQTIVLSENLDISVYTGTFDVIDKEWTEWFSNGEKRVEVAYKSGGDSKVGKGLSLIHI